MPLIVEIAAVCAAEVALGTRMWAGRRSSLTLLFALLPFEAADWIGFALPFGVVLGAIRTAAVAAALRRGRRPGPRDLIDLLSVDDASWRIPWRGRDFRGDHAAGGVDRHDVGERATDVDTEPERRRGTGAPVARARASFSGCSLTATTIGAAHTHRPSAGHVPATDRPECPDRPL